MGGCADINVHHLSVVLIAFAPLILGLCCNDEERPGVEPHASVAATNVEVAQPPEEPSQAPRMDGEALVITFGGEYEPFAWGEGSAVQGVQVDFVHEILGNRMGLSVITEGCPWKRCQKLVRAGKRDGFFTVPTLEREKYASKSSIPFYQTRFVMHVSANNPVAKDLERVESLSDLAGMPHIRHIYMYGSGWHDIALRNMRSVQTVPDASAIPRMLVLGRADLYIEQAEMFRYQAEAEGVSAALLTIEEPAIRTVGWHLFISKQSKHSAILTDVDQMLESLKASGELEKIKRTIFEKYGLLAGGPASRDTDR